MVSAQNLSEYYSNIYSKCSVENSFLASWQGLAYPSHVFQAIGFPFQMLTFWLILKKTPDSMKSIKKPLLIAHILCTLLDIHFSTLVTPYMFLPSFTYLPLGVLGLFKVPVLVQSFLMVETLIAVLISLVYVFECRSRSIQENRIKFESKTARTIYYVILYLLPSLSLLLYFKVPHNQEIAKLEALQLFPCPTKEFFLDETFVVLSDPFWLSFTLAFAIPAIAILIFGNIIFHVSCCIFHLYMTPGAMTSIRTRLIQRRFFIGMFAQTGVPFVVLAIPYTLLGVSMAINRISQVITNLSFISFGLHGIVESACVLTFHHSYRLYIQNIFMKTKTIKSEFLRRVFQVESGFFQLYQVTGVSRDSHRIH
ncbi:hypothetical protein CRE_20015 [Caenorhabditis remanei]|uniref:Serpentine Receptor, class H n=1 Tax=Caenorhabditis remanei TaxID=31234 RepID=E3NCF7_CAERE|nr:hypothetical protein CRE_20015 [Caenorhabditis remanei]